MPNSVTKQLRRMGWSDEAIARAKIDGKPVNQADKPKRGPAQLTFTAVGVPIAQHANATESSAKAKPHMCRTTRGRKTP